MKYAAYIEIEGPERREKLEEALNWSLYEMLKREQEYPSFDVSVHIIPSLEEWKEQH